MLPPPCDMSMELQRPNTLNSYQIYSVYPILTRIGGFVSIPSWTALDHQSRWYKPSTSRFQKT